MRCSRSTCSGAVPGDAALPAGRREQLALLVEADGVDGDLGAAGELLDPDLAVGGLSFRGGTAVPMSGDSRSSCSHGQY